MKAKDIAHVALLTAIAIILGVVECYIPSIGIPGIKLGLANIAILITLYAYSWYYAILVNLIRVFIVALVRGSLFQMGFFMSLAGALLSAGVMIVLVLIIKKLHVITVSVIGSIFHIGGQIVVAIIFTSTPGVIYYFPFLLLSAVVTGIIVGFVASKCLKLPIFKKEISAEVEA